MRPSPSLSSPRPIPAFANLSAWQSLARKCPCFFSLDLRFERLGMNLGGRGIAGRATACNSSSHKQGRQRLGEREIGRRGEREMGRGRSILPHSLSPPLYFLLLPF